MLHQAEELYEQLVEKLRVAEIQSATSPSQLRETNLSLINETIRVLKELVIHHNFSDIQEEVHFFKHVKPKFISLLIYNARLFQIELNKPIGSLKDVSSHYEQELQLIRIYHQQHVQLCQYMRANATYLDSKLFVRGVSDHPFYYSTTTVDMDSRFTTHYDYVVARIQANERLRNYLLNALHELETGGIITESHCEQRQMNWTGPKVHLIELAYALNASGHINNGAIDVIEIVSQLEKIFRVRLGNVYRTFQEMRQRKKDSRTKFLDLMREKLIYRMDELDSA